ncbi:MAG: MFS transporter [Blastocatellia bacterium]
MISPVEDLSESSNSLATDDRSTPGDSSLASEASEPRQPRSPSLRRRIATRLLRSLIAVLVGSLVLRLAAQSMTQMIQFYLEAINDRYYPISYSTRGYVLASFFVTELIGALVLGAMSDRYGRKVFIILGPLLGALAVQITAMTMVIWLLVFTRLLAGLSTGSSIPATLGYISEATVGRPNLRARIIGFFDLTLVIGIAAGAVVGGYLWKFFGEPRTVAGIPLMSPAFSINALIYLASLAILAWGLRDVKRPARDVSAARAVSHAAAARKKLSHYREIVKSPSVWMFIPAWLSIFALIGLWTNNSVGLLTGNHHFDGQLLTGTIAPERYGTGFAILAFFFAVGLLVWSFVLARYRKTSVMLISTLALFALLLTVYAFNHLGSFSSPFYHPLLGALLIEVLVLSGFTPAALTYLADATEDYSEDRGSIMGLYSVFLGIGQLAGTAIGGRFAQWNGIDGLLLMSAVLSAITLVSLIALRRVEPSATRLLAPEGGLQ